MHWKQWVRLFKGVEIILTLLKSNTMGEVLTSKGMAEGQSTTILKFLSRQLWGYFLLCLHYGRKVCPGSRTVPAVPCSCHVKTQFLNVEDWFFSGGKISGREIWKNICSLTWFTHSLQPGNGGNHKPITGYFLFQRFPHTTISSSQDTFLSHQPLPNAAIKEKKKILMDATAYFKDFCITKWYRLPSE